ncbi:DUF6790 family protein [Microbacterium sp.]|uniref:DUF6790 family protein n=1 Tax=Microbacterium sp. TaxID=51671 RepID=UPI002D773033|nr:DUF6790 family protein [Microbacterium sp.]HET6299849.1 DUF6790 family protein [Microbacterium sp.]
MKYLVLIALTVVLPIVFGVSEAVSTGGDVILILGKWWVFWGIGARLAGAGLMQLLNPSFTTKILGTAEPTGTELQVVRELGAANLGMGLAGLLALVQDWFVPGGLAGGVFLLIAGIMHVAKRGKGAYETLATWTDLLVAVVYAVSVVWFTIHALS